MDRPPRLTDEQLGRRSHARSARMELLMSPELKARVRAAAAAEGRTALPWVLDAIQRCLPPELDLDEGQEQPEVRMAG